MPLFPVESPAERSVSRVEPAPGRARAPFARLCLRVRKEERGVDRTCPYVYTRNPLYLDSSSWLRLCRRLPQPVDHASSALLFTIIYVPTIYSEEQFLRATFPAFAGYAQQVPRLLPRLTPARIEGEGSFSGALGQSVNTASTIPFWVPVPFTLYWWPRCGSAIDSLEKVDGDTVSKTCRVSGVCLRGANRRRADASSFASPGSKFLFPHQANAHLCRGSRRVFPAGTATFHLEQVGGMQHVVATGESIGAVNLLFRVNDRFESYFNRTTGCSTSFAKQLQEGRRQLVSTLRFLPSERKEVLEEKNLVTGTSKHQELPIPPCVTDLMSAIFYGGSQPMQPGGIFHMP